MPKKERPDKPGSKPAALKVVAGGPARRARGADHGGDFEAVRTLARIAAEFDLAEIEVDGGGHIRVRRGGGADPAPAAARPLALAPTPAPADDAADGGAFISSPFVGTFYAAASPESPPFVQAGQSVRKGQVVCIVEAMKLMNEIEAEADGRIVDVLAANGEHVEYGQHLFRLARV